MCTFSLIILVFHFNQPPEGPKCKFFMWKDATREEGYYKQQLRKLRFEVHKKEDISEVSKAQKKVIQLQQAMDAEKEVFKRQLIELIKKNIVMKTYLGTAKCIIFVLLILVIGMWLKCR